VATARTGRACQAMRKALCDSINSLLIGFGDRPPDSLAATIAWLLNFAWQA
jgi:hypothetical protein